MSGAPGHIAILGGGTAGWMAACLMAQRWGRLGTRVTVIESPEIGIIGVGEGSTPHLKHFFDTVGLGEADWMSAADATYKAGIGFHGWSDAPGFDSYFHPFPTELDPETAPDFFAATRARRRGAPVEAHPDRYFLPTRLAAERRAPIAPDSYGHRIGYGYHFDAHKVGATLRTHATSRLGVVHREARIAEVVVRDGAVGHLVTGTGERIAADLFVDASGFRSVIHQQALAVPFQSYADALFNDAAVVLPTPLGPHGPDVQTRAVALSAGWAWAIPLTTRVGNGYVYSSRHLDRDAAEAELRAHLGVGDEIPARHLAMRVGRVEASWHANSLAIGLAQGFLEPLEATALHIVQSTIEGFVQAWEDGAFTPRHRDVFNRTIAARYDGIRDYIVCHYRVNQRRDTPYWRDAAQVPVSDSLARLLDCWFTGGDLTAEIEAQGIGRYYAPLSWHCLLGGYGVYPDPARMRTREAAPEHDPMPRIDAFIAREAAKFPAHAEALARLR